MILCSFSKFSTSQRTQGILAQMDQSVAPNPATSATRLHQPVNPGSVKLMMEMSTWSCSAWSQASQDASED